MTLYAILLLLSCYSTANAFYAPITRSISEQQNQHSNRRGPATGGSLRRARSQCGVLLSAESPDEEPSSTTDEISGSSLDWDSAWQQKQEELKKQAAAREALKVARPAFSGRSEIIVTGNENDGWEYVEVKANGSGRDVAGFRFESEEDTRGGRARKDIMEREVQLVEAVAFDKVFQVGIAVIAVLLALMVNVYNSGGITNGATRFAGMEMPMYEDRPIAIPHPSNQVYPEAAAVDSDLVV